MRKIGFLVMFTFAFSVLMARPDTEDKKVTQIGGSNMCWELNYADEGLITGIVDNSESGQELLWSYDYHVSIDGLPFISQNGYFQPSNEFYYAEGEPTFIRESKLNSDGLIGEESDCYTLLLPYGSGDKWSMIIFLPKEGKTVRDVVNSLDMSKWYPYHYGAALSMNVDIKLPRFESSYKADVKSALQKMGVKSVFEANKADLSLISKNKNLYVYKMEQTAAIEVNEEGTRTSAVTVAEKGVSDAGILGDKVYFYANTPFVYMIREASSGAVFFIGTYQGE